MALVDEAELERLRQRQIKEYSPALRSLGQIQEQIEKLFDDPELTDEGKCKILSHLQDRFSVTLAQYKNSTSGTSPAAEAKPLQIEIKSENDPIINDELEEINGSNKPGEEDPLNSTIPTAEEAKIPAQYNKKFKMFQEFLKEHQNEISMNEQKQLVIDGEAIAYSSFPDLLRSLYVRNQDMNLNGAQQLHLKLNHLNARPDMFSNRDTLASLTHLEKKTQKHSQTGFGVCPPGKKPRFLRVFR